MSENYDQTYVCINIYIVVLLDRFFYSVINSSRNKTESI